MAKFPKTFDLPLRKIDFEKPQRFESNTDCPIARALKRKFPDMTNITVHTYAIYFDRSGESYKYLITDDYTVDKYELDAFKASKARTPMAILRKVNLTKQPYRTF